MLSVAQTIFKTLLAVLIGGFCVLAPADAPAAGPGAVGAVNVDVLNLRSKPGTDKPALAKLYRGDKIVILVSANGWLKVVCRGQVGYIQDKAEFITAIKGEEKAKEGAAVLKAMTREAGTVSKNILQGESKIAALAKKEATLVNGLNEIDFVLTEVRRKMADLQSSLTEIDAQMNETVQSIEKRKQAIGEYKKYAGQRLVALYKLSKLGGMAHVLISADSIHDLFKRKIGFERVLAYDEKMLISYSGDMARLNALFDLQKEQKTKKRLLEDEFKNQCRVAEKEKEKRGQLLSYIRSQKQTQSVFLASLKEAAAALDSKIKSYNTSMDAPREDNGKSFAELKGLLNMPVKGRVVSLFGPYTDIQYNTANFRSGIDIRADRGEPIRAVCSGKVLFSEWFKGYGNMMIIDHGDHYYTVYAHIQELFKPTGSIVKTGEVIATTGDSGSLVGPKLYFEIRHHGEPLNPLKWIKKG